jgi:uncharacterized protein YijF (DUF1287 family)
MRNVAVLIVSAVLAMASACRAQQVSQTIAPSNSPSPILKPLPPAAPHELKQLIDGALQQVGITKGYDPSYVSIAYPGGDVAIETGVCSDVLVRAFRKAGVDLQRLVHEDMVRAWAAYPRNWGNTGPDTNIDHRRVKNLMTFFERQGKSVGITKQNDDYLPADIVSWDLGNGVDHIGIVSNSFLVAGGSPLIVHNIGSGTKIEDVLFAWRITGHYRYFK